MNDYIYINIIGRIPFMEKKHRHELSPEQIVLDTFAFCRTRVLSTAVDLELFTHISQGKKTAAKAFTGHRHQPAGA